MAMYVTASSLFPPSPLTLVGVDHRLICQQCGSIMFAEPKKTPDIVFLKVGLLDDKAFLDGLGAPKMDIYCKNLWSWERPIEGAQVAQAGA